MDLPMPTPAQIRGYDGDAPTRDETATATFALGCFWGPDAQFGAMDGVIRTRVGYAGGTSREPTYRAIGDHTEAFQIDYDPRELSYADLLEVVFHSHDPHSQARKTQYQNIVFTATADQHEALISFLDATGLSVDGIQTRVERLGEFTLAEAYHQKYDLRSRSPLVGAFEDAGYDADEIRESPAAAKLNGYAGGNDISAAAELGVPGDSPGRTR